MTAAELIAKLQAFPPETLVVILDADTNWALELLEVRNELDPALKTVAALRGDYDSIHANQLIP